MDTIDIRLLISTKNSTDEALCFFVLQLLLFAIRVTTEAEIDLKVPGNLLVSFNRTFQNDNEMTAVSFKSW